MNFEQALAAMRRGEKVRREGWWKRLCIFIADDFLYEGLLNVHGGERVISSMFYEDEDVTINDILATDWEIVQSEADQKLHEFNGA